ncbi:MAG: PEP-CTERM sorting domain-containing protein [Armatimonas sp.]
MFKRIALATLSMALLVGSAFAQFTTTQAGPINSAGDEGDPGNGSFTSTYSGASSLFGSFSFSGTLTSVASGTWVEDSAFAIHQTTALGGLTDVYLTPGSGQEYTTENVNFTTGGLFWFNSGSQYNFEAIENFDDGAGTDATWTNLEFMFSDSVTITNIGSFVAGTPVVIDTTGSPGDIDTELAAYTADGMLLDLNDDIDFDNDNFLSLIDLGTLPVGDYNVVLGTFNSDFFDGFAIPGGGSGNFVVNVNGTQVSSGSLEADKFHVMKFSILGPTSAPEPGTLALLGLVALPGVALLRRRK